MTERVFTVVGSEATPATPISLAEAGLKEREDLQEWVIAHPEILGPEVLIVTLEFDRWASSSGRRERDRLDVLGIGSDGRLVVGELKRDRAPDTVEMQAIKYASLVSRFTEESLVEQYVRFSGRNGSPLGEDQARQRLIEHAGEFDPEQLRRPRIVLVAGAFSPIVTSSVVWLTEMGLDVTLQRVQAYRVLNEQTIVTVSQLFPLPDVEEFTVSPQRAQLKVAEEKRTRNRDTTTVARLVASNLLEDGTELFLRPTSDVSSEVQASVAEWVAEDDKRRRAIWHNDKLQPLEWLYDGQRYKPIEIVRRILMDAAGLDRAVRGPRWWVLKDGRDLRTVAGIAEAFDWSTLHEILANVPPGSWTTYGDLAAVVGTAPQPLGQHVTKCGECPNAYRVLGSDGRPRDNFRWEDPSDHRSQEEALRSEGVNFFDGMASKSQRVLAQDLVKSTGGPPSDES